MNTTNKTAVEENVRDFCKHTPRINPESGVAFYERLTKYTEKITTQAHQQGERDERERCVKALEDDLDILSDCTDKSYNRHVEYKEDENGFYSGEKNGYIGAYAVINHTRKALQLPDKE